MKKNTRKGERCSLQYKIRNKMSHKCSNLTFNSRMKVISKRRSKKQKSNKKMIWIKQMSCIKQNKKSCKFYNCNSFLKLELKSKVDEKLIEEIRKKIEYSFEYYYFLLWEDQKDLITLSNR